MPDQALAGRGIAITRPADQSRQLADLIAKQGGQPILFPLLAIAPLDDYATFDQNIDCLDHYDWAIFISSNAVQQGMPRLMQRYRALPAKLRFAAIGPSTAAELSQSGVTKVLTPSECFDSEHLLALPEMQQVRGQRIIIFRGEGGRELLAEGLRARGAEVDFAECYRRVNPQTDAGDLPRLWQNNQLHAIVVTSSEALRNLIDLAGDAKWLSSTLLCVNHARIAELAQRHGLRVAVAERPGDAAMLQCLICHTTTGEKSL
jgi:uroporphyrinogen-III synthase